MTRIATLAIAALAGSCATTTPTTSSKPAPEPKAPAANLVAKEAAGPPQAARRPVSDTYHGVTVVDDYRWLESWSDPEVKAWSTKQDQHARRYLAALPDHEKIRRQVAAAVKRMGVSYRAVAQVGQGYLVLKHAPPKQQPLLEWLPSLDERGGGRVVLDPNEIDKTGGTHIDWFRPSPDGKLVAISLSKSGTEAGDVHVYQLRGAKEVFEVVPRVNGGTAGGDLVWDHRGKGFFYTRYPRGKERPQKDQSFFVQVYYHRLGTPTDQDRYELGKGMPRIAEYDLRREPKGQRVLALVQKGDGGEFEHFLRDRRGRWHKLAAYEDRIVESIFGPRNDLYLISLKDAPLGKVLRLPLSGKPRLARAKLVIAEAKDALVPGFWTLGMLATKTRLYVLYQLGGPSEIRAFDLRGKPLPGPKLAPVSAVSSLAALSDGRLLFYRSSYLDPGAWQRFEPREATVSRTALYNTPPIPLEGVRVVRELATSKDGTKVPINILLPPGFKRDGRAPAVVSGYGGYGVSLYPRYRLRMALPVGRGIVVAEANLRGGGEFGERWHRQGYLIHKQNVFDDFAAVIEHLVARRYTSRARLAIEGGSNGGLLMGATMVQRPELAKAVISHVGIYDMLRVELTPNGAFNVTEFGTVSKPDHFKALHAYSPYHQVKDGTAYPAALFLTGKVDPRVSPWHSRKMVARLQAASSAKAPILLRTSDAGHGLDTALSERIDKLAAVTAFLTHQLGVPFKPGK